MLSCMMRPKPGSCVKSNPVLIACSNASQLPPKCLLITRPAVRPTVWMPQPAINWFNVQLRLLSILACSRAKDFSPEPSASMIASRWRSNAYRSPKLVTHPRLINFFSVFCDRPSIFIRVRSQKCTNLSTSFAGQAGFMQYRKRVPPLVFFSVRGSAQHGQELGSTAVPLRVRFSASWGMI